MLIPEPSKAHSAHTHTQFQHFNEKNHSCSSCARGRGGVRECVIASKNRAQQRELREDEKTQKRDAGAGQERSKRRCPYLLGVVLAGFCGSLRVLCWWLLWKMWGLVVVQV